MWHVTSVQHESRMNPIKNAGTSLAPSQSYPQKKKQELTLSKFFLDFSWQHAQVIQAAATRTIDPIAKVAAAALDIDIPPSACGSADSSLSDCNGAMTEPILLSRRQTRKWLSHKYFWTCEKQQPIRSRLLHTVLSYSYLEDSISESVVSADQACMYKQSNMTCGNHGKEKNENRSLTQLEKLVELLHSEASHSTYRR